MSTKITARVTPTPAPATSDEATAALAEIGRNYTEWRRIERQMADIKARDPFSGELAARGELQRALDTAAAATRAAADAVIDGE